MWPGYFSKIPFLQKKEKLMNVNRMLDARCPCECIENLEPEL